jgi:hypothetical protein
MQIWVKNYNGSTTINMQVLPSFENLFSATGYLGKYNTTTDNGRLVWNNYTSNIDPSAIPSGWSDSVSGFSYLSQQVSQPFSVLAQIAVTVVSTNRNPIFFDTSPTLPHPTGIDEDGGSTNFYAYNGTYHSFAPFSTSLLDFESATNGNYSTFTIGSNSITVGNDFTSNSYYVGMYIQSDFSTINFFAVGNFPSSMPTFTIGAFTNMTDHVDVSYLSNSITIPMPNWFNLTLKAYTNYSFTFQYNNTPLYFTYDGLINNTIYTGFFDHNLTLDIHFIALGYSGKTQSIVLERG